VSFVASVEGGSVPCPGRSAVSFCGDRKVLCIGFPYYCILNDLIHSTRPFILIASAFLFFSRPLLFLPTIRVGPEADLREIEYLSAIHQSEGTSIRPDGTISAADVRVYLRSRYGLYISKEEATQIVRGLGGTAKVADADQNDGDADDMDIEKNSSNPNSPVPTTDGQDSKHGAGLDDNNYLDLVQFLAILFIPTLQRAKRQVDIERGIVKIAPIPMLPNTNWRLIFTQRKTYQENKKLSKQLTQERTERELHDSLEPSHSEEEGGNCIHMVLRIFFEAIGEKSGIGTPRSLDMLPHVILSHDLVIKLLEAFGFSDLAANDELIDQMVQAAGGSGTLFDELSFAKALTSDVWLRETGNEDKKSETFEDVYGYDMSKVHRSATKKLADRRKMNKDGKLATFLVKQHAEDSSSKGSNYEDRFVHEEREASTMNDAAPVATTPTHKNGPADEPPTAGDEEWASSNNDDTKTVGWSTAKAVVDMSVSLNGEIEVKQPVPPQEPSPQISRGEHDPILAVETDLNGNNEEVQKTLDDREDDDVSVELKKPKYISMVPAIDYVNDEYKSIAYLCGTWIYFIFAAAGFMTLLTLVDLQVFKCSDGFFCNLGKQVWSWLVFGIMLSFGGLFVVAPLR